MKLSLNVRLYSNLILLKFKLRPNQKKISRILNKSIITRYSFPLNILKRVTPGCRELKWHQKLFKKIFHKFSDFQKF